MLLRAACCTLPLYSSAYYGVSLACMACSSCRRLLGAAGGGCASARAGLDRVQWRGGHLAPAAQPQRQGRHLGGRRAVGSPHRLQVSPLHRPLNLPNTPQYLKWLRYCPPALGAECLRLRASDTIAAWSSLVKMQYRSLACKGPSTAALGHQQAHSPPYRLCDCTRLLQAFHLNICCAMAGGTGTPWRGR